MARLSEWTARAELTAPLIPPVVEADFTEIVDNTEENPVVGDTIEVLLSSLGKSSEFNYTSDSPEQDFSIAIELMLETGIYLKILRDLNKRFGVMSENQEKEFREHVEKVEEFTGQWG